MRKSHLLAFAAAAALAGTSAVSKAAVTVTVTWELSTNGGVSYSPVVGNAVTVPLSQAAGAGPGGADQYDIGMLVTLSGLSPNPAYSGNGGTYSVAQPAFLGLAAWGYGFSDGNTLASLDPSNVVVDGPPSGVGPYTTQSSGTADGVGGISSPTLSDRKSVV